MKKNKLKKINKLPIKGRKLLIPRFDLPEDTKRKIYGIIMFLLAVIVSFSFFDKAGIGGEFLMNSLTFLIGRTIFILPLLFILAGLVFLAIKSEPKPKRDNGLIIGGIFIAVLGIAGILETLGFYQNIPKEYGGLLGYIISFPLIKLLGIWGAGVVFSAVIIIGGIILYQSAPFLFLKREKKKDLKTEEIIEKEKPSLSARLFQKVKGPEFKIKQIESEESSEDRQEPKGLFGRRAKPSPVETEPKPVVLSETAYQFPPLNLLEKDQGIPYSGDIRVNSSIIQKTLQNFGIPVEMSEINIGPTVTQYTLKPAEGIKLSKITALNSDLSLALASHPIRIEAPIPGRSLVGIELPNKRRTKVGLRSLLELPKFQEKSSPLNIALGRDVAGNSVFVDIAKMPHLLVAGSTGSGKTICLNGIILSLLFGNSPSSLRFILVDPKRVEFPIYNSLPHLLSPVVFRAQETVDVLKWLIGEMERRFDVLSDAKARDIIGYNEIIAKNQHSDLEPMPYIVLIIDELADIMAARGREVEAGIVRLAQMSRATGIHLIVATQRPSVEVVTGLIKANITSRITFQVASQVDSRTILDTAGAEKLLGFGDMLFISSDVSKPKRIQGAYVLEREVKKVINYIKSQGLEKVQDIKEELAGEKIDKSLEKVLETSVEEEDPLYEEAKNLVIQSKRASASLLQRRLRLGYARAARLIDTLEEKGVIGPGEGAKPREVYISEEQEKSQNENDENNEDNEDNENNKDIEDNKDDGYVKV